MTQTMLATDCPDLTALHRYARRADARAFEMIVQRYQQMVFATCLRTLGNRADAEDATQETFVKLARHAARIRSNPAAWLHAAARTTALDAVRARAAARSADTAGSAADPHGQAHADAASYRELTERLDHALDQLADSERELIVQRFLCGRAETDLAREAGIHPGTMHRRIDRALQRLRARLPAEALVAVPAAGLGDQLLSLSESIHTPATLQADLIKVGLTGTGASGPPAVWGGVPLIAALIAVLTSVGLIGLAARNLSAGRTGATASAAPVATGLTRPARALPPRTLVGDTQVAEDDLLTSDGLSLRFRFVPEGAGRSATLDLRIQRADLAVRQPSLQLLLERADFPPRRDNAPDPEAEAFRAMIGQTLEADCRIVDGALLLRLRANGRTWHGVRLQESPAATGAPAPQLAGRWGAINTWSLRMGPEDLRITTPDGFELYRLRVLSWEQGDQSARVQAIFADSVDPTVVGRRIKLLLSKDGERVRMVTNPWRGPQADEWPEPDATDARTLVWREVP